MSPGEALAMVARPAFSGTMRARKTKKERRSVSAKQWISYVAIAALTTWATQNLYDHVDERFGEPGC
jgi:hypothetical protein